jgi:hypothetical protein
MDAALLSYILLALDRLREPLVVFCKVWWTVEFMNFRRGDNLDTFFDCHLNAQKARF